MHPALATKTGVSVYVRAKSLLSDSVRLYGLQPARLLYPWNSPGQNTGVGNLDLRLPASKPMRNKFPLFKSCPDYGALL